MAHSYLQMLILQVNSNSHPHGWFIYVQQLIWQVTSNSHPHDSFICENHMTHSYICNCWYHRSPAIRTPMNDSYVWEPHDSFISATAHLTGHQQHTITCRIHMCNDLTGHQKLTVPWLIHMCENHMTHSRLRTIWLIHIYNCWSKRSSATHTHMTHSYVQLLILLTGHQQLTPKPQSRAQIHP